MILKLIFWLFPTSTSLNKYTETVLILKSHFQHFNLPEVSERTKKKFWFDIGFTDQAHKIYDNEEHCGGWQGGAGAREGLGAGVVRSKK